MAQKQEEVEEFVTDRTKFRPKSETCKIVLASPTPCAFPRIIFLMCYAWNKVHYRAIDFTIREKFVEGLREAREIWEEKCGV